MRRDKWLSQANNLMVFLKLGSTITARIESYRKEFILKFLIGDINLFSAFWTGNHSIPSLFFFFYRVVLNKKLCWLTVETTIGNMN